MSEKYGEPLHLIKDDSDAFEVRNSQGKSVISICLVDGMEWTDYEFDTEEVLSRFVSLYNLCAGLSDDECKAMRELWEKREEIRGVLRDALKQYDDADSPRDAIRAALSLIGGSDETK